MRNSLLAGIGLAASVLVSSGVSSAGFFSVHPFSSCTLTQNSGNYLAISGASHFGGVFTNLSGSTARAMCSMPFQPNFSNFRVSGTSTVSSCIMKMTGSSGGVTLVFGTRSGNTFTFPTGFNSGEYSAEAECVLPNNAGLWHLANY